MGHDSTAKDSSTQSKTYAEKLHENRIIYLLFGIADGLSNSSSIISYIIQISFPSDPMPQNKMHVWLMSPVGIALTIIEATFITIFSMLGCYFKDKRDGSFKSLLARIWPYVRDAIKGVKNAYKAVRSILFIAVVFGASALVFSSLLLPLGIVFGIAYLYTRAWNRSMVYDRLNMEETNTSLAEWNGLSVKTRQKRLEDKPFLKKLIQTVTNGDPAEVILEDKVRYKLIQEQSPSLKVKAYVSAAFAELINGIYLYAGIYLLCTLIPPLALVVNLFSIFFAITSVIRGIYEEYTYQSKLERTIIKAKLACKDCLSKEEISKLEAREAQLDRINYLGAFGEGLRNGLSAYSAITGCIFAVSIFTPIPMICLMITISLGAVSVIGFVAHNLWYTNKVLNSDGNKSAPFNPTADRLEVARSFAAGIRQSPKITRNFILNHIRDSKAALVVTGIASVILTFIYSHKAYAKGCRPPEKTFNNPILQQTNSMTRLSSSSSTASSPSSSLSSTTNSSPEPATTTVIAESVIERSASKTPDLITSCETNIALGSI